MNNTPDTLLSKCRECDNADPTSIASCGCCGRAVCDDCYALRHEGKKCIPAMHRDREELWRAQEVIRRLTKWDSGKMEFTHADDSRISEWEQMIVKKAHAELAAAKEMG